MSLSRAHETTNAVDLHDETVPGSQAMLGVVGRLSAAKLAFEFSNARVNARSFKVGVSF